MHTGVQATRETNDRPSPNDHKETTPMRMFWTIFFLGSMLLVGYDVAERRARPERTPIAPVADGDAIPIPTPNL